LKVHTLRALSAEAILVFACASRETRVGAHSEDLWAGLFQRDWRWLCPTGPPCDASFRQQHLWVSQQARHECSAFVVLGGTVRREGAAHSDAAVLSALGNHDGELQWRSFALRVPGRCAAGLCRSRGRILAVGGFDFSSERSTAAAESINVRAVLQGQPVAQALPRLQRARACPGVVATSEAVLAIGGGSSMFTAAQAFSSVEVLTNSAQTSEWRAAPPLGWPRCAAGACATAAGTVFAVSGYAGGDRYEDSVEWTDATGSEGLLRGWRPAPALAHARAGCVACFGPEGCVWALGGGCNESESLASVERLDPRVQRWRADVPPMPGRRRCFAGGFGVDGKLYIYGGWDSSRWHDPTAARLDLRAMRWEPLPALYGEVNGIIPYHFVSGCVAF